tara:strand:+ start:414 stop:686 length:273 start_codon:yes stop_codon:yes gene_type:complete
MSKIEELNKKSYIVELCGRERDEPELISAIGDIGKFLKKERDWVIRDFHYIAAGNLGIFYVFSSKEIDRDKASDIAVEVKGKLGTYIVNE